MSEQQCSNGGFEPNRPCKLVLSAFCLLLEADLRLMIKAKNGIEREIWSVVKTLHNPHIA